MAQNSVATSCEALFHDSIIIYSDGFSFGLKVARLNKIFAHCNNHGVQ